MVRRAAAVRDHTADPRALSALALPLPPPRRAAALLQEPGLRSAGSYLGAMSLDFMAQAFPGSEVGLAPLARLLGEEEPGVVTRVAISGFEGLLFGAGLALGLTRRPSGDSGAAGSAKPSSRWLRRVVSGGPKKGTCRPIDSGGGFHGLNRLGAAAGGIVARIATDGGVVGELLLQEHAERRLLR